MFERVEMLVRRLDVSDGMRRIRELNRVPVSVFDWASPQRPSAVKGAPLPSAVDTLTRRPSTGSAGGSRLNLLQEMQKKARSERPVIKLDPLTLST